MSLFAFFEQRGRSPVAQTCRNSVIAPGYARHPCADNDAIRQCGGWVSCEAMGLCECLHELHTARLHAKAAHGRVGPVQACSPTRGAGGIPFAGSEMSALQKKCGYSAHAEATAKSASAARRRERRGSGCGGVRRQDRAKMLGKSGGGPTNTQDSATGLDPALGTEHWALSTHAHSTNALPFLRSAPSAHTNPAHALTHTALTHFSSPIPPPHPD